MTGLTPRMTEDNDAVELDDDAETEAVDAAVEEEADTTEEPTADAAAEEAPADAEPDATEDAGDDADEEEDASPFDDDVMPDDDVDLLIPVEDYLCRVSTSGPSRRRRIWSGLSTASATMACTYST